MEQRIAEQPPAPAQTPAERMPEKRMTAKRDSKSA
jgi:hypothetical protein